jgi:hypothetical protein
MAAPLVEPAAMGCGASGSDNERGSEHHHQPTLSIPARRQGRRSTTFLSKET